MTPAEAYLLLRRGKITPLQTSRESLTIALDPEFTRVLVSEHRVSLTMVTRPALCFRIKGRNKILQGIEAALDARRKVKLPSSSRHETAKTLLQKIQVERIRKSSIVGSSLTELYQSISDMSGAFLETDPRNDQYAIVSYLDPTSRDQALHLLSLAQIQLELEPNAARVLAMVGSEAPAPVQEQPPANPPASSSVPETYALYPHISPHPIIPSSTSQQAGMTGPVPHRDWTLTGKNLFRVRRLGGWFGSAGQGKGRLQDVSKELALDAKSRE